MPTTDDIIKRILAMVTYYEIGEAKRVGDEYRVRQFLQDIETRRVVDAARLAYLEGALESQKRLSQDLVDKIFDLEDRIENLKMVAESRNWDLDDMRGLRGGPG